MVAEVWAAAQSPTPTPTPRPHVRNKEADFVGLARQGQVPGLVGDVLATQCRLPTGSMPPPLLAGNCPVPRGPAPAQTAHAPAGRPLSCPLPQARGAFCGCRLPGHPSECLS